MVDFYSPQEISVHHKKLHNAISIPSHFARENSSIVASLQQVEKNVPLVELGCGSGTFTKELIKLGFTSIHGLDIDNYINHEEVGSQITFHKANLSNDKIPLPNASVGAVIGIALLEHLENPFFCLREVTRVLKTGGLFIFSLPHIDSLHSRLRFLFHGEVYGYTETNNHLVIFTNGVLHKYIKNNFELKSVEYSDGWIKIFGFKLRLPGKPFLSRWFGTKVCYTLVKK